MAALYEAQPEEMIHKTKSIFYSNMTIYSDSEEERLMLKNNSFLSFLNLDDRKDLLEKVERGDVSALNSLDQYVV